MREYIDILEDDEDRAFDEQNKREKHIEELIRYAFKAVGLEISDENFSINYSEDPDREATVLLYDIEASLSNLAKLQETGLADGYKISSGDMKLYVTFIVKPEMDYAKIG